MKIAKYLHSCLLFEDEGHKLLFDPGAISFAEGRVAPETFGDVDTVVITYSHADHLDLDTLKQIVASSKAEIIANDEVAAILADRLPQHTAYLIDERVLNAVDSFGEPLLAYAGIDTLIVPVMAPFLTEVRVRVRQGHAPAAGDSDS